MHTWLTNSQQGIQEYPVERIVSSVNAGSYYIESNSFTTPWTAAHQAPGLMRFSRQEYLSGLPFPSTGDVPNPGMVPESPALAGGFFTTEPPGRPFS